MTGKTVDMDTMPLRWGHYKLFIIASLGQLIGAGLATLIGIIMPMIQLVNHSGLSALEQGIVSCMSLAGIMTGSSLIGSLSDRYGYLFFIRLCPALILISSLFAFYMDNTVCFGIGLFFMGLGIGGEYTLGSDYISEIMPNRFKLLMVGAAKATSAIGSILIAGICFFLLKKLGQPEIWNHLLLIISCIALIMLLLRLRFTQSPGWLIAKGRMAEAEKAVKFFLGNDVVIGEIKDTQTQRTNVVQSKMGDLFKKGNIKKVIFSGIPWACEGFGVYGIGIFLPMLVMALGLEHSSGSSFQKVINSIEITTYINVFVLIGFIVGLYFVDKLYHVTSQVSGFLLCSIGIGILWLCYTFHLPIWVAILGFLIFEVFLNAGPHLMTFIIPPQIYSVEERGAGVGLAASIGKIGAILAVFFIPNLLAWGGVGLVLLTAIVVNIIGALVTAIFGKEVLPNDEKQTKPFLHKIRHFRW